MPKSRKHRRKTATRTFKLSEADIAILRYQREAFRQKFGRDPGPNDPVFFDPDADEPVKMASNRMDADIIMALRRSGAPSEVEYAFRKTGLLYLGGDRSLWPEDRVEEWDAAIAEYHLLMSKEGGTA
jgi:hypothetical protein